jgi:hypothetical protein
MLERIPELNWPRHLFRDFSNVMSVKAPRPCYGG